MSKFLEIQNAIKSLGPGEYQRFVQNIVLENLNLVICMT